MIRFQSLKTKIILSVIVVVVVIEGVFLYLNIRSLSQQMIDKTEEEAFNLSEKIRLSIRYAMIKDRRDEYQRIIDDVAKRKGIVEVRIFNKAGKITVSSDESKVGTVVDMKAEACYGCHRECSSPPPCVPQSENCNDGTDNDCDGVVDCADPDCRQDTICSPPPSNDYSTYCAGCHGTDGSGGDSAGDIRGRTAREISRAIRNVGAMKSLRFLTRA